MFKSISQYTAIKESTQSYTSELLYRNCSQSIRYPAVYALKSVLSTRNPQL